MLNELLERKIAEAAEWFCDNPNRVDIEDAMRELVAEAVSMENAACAKVLRDKHNELAKRSYPPPSILIELEIAILERSNKR